MQGIIMSENNIQQPAARGVIKIFLLLVPTFLQAISNHYDITINLQVPKWLNNNIPNLYIFSHGTQV